MIDIKSQSMVQVSMSVQLAYYIKIHFRFCYDSCTTVLMYGLNLCQVACSGPILLILHFCNIKFSCIAIDAIHF